MADPTNADGFVSPYSRGAIEPTMTAEQVVAARQSQAPEAPQSQSQDVRPDAPPMRQDLKEAVANSRKQDAPKQTPTLTTADKPPAPKLEMKGPLGDEVRRQIAKAQAMKAYENLQTCNRRVKPLSVGDDFRAANKPKHGI